QRAGHAAANLNGRRSMQVRVIPVRAGWVVEADAIFVLAELSGLNTEPRVIHDEVAIDARRHQAGRDVQSMRVKIGAIRIAQMLGGLAAWGIWGKLVHDPDSERVSDVD